MSPWNHWAGLSLGVSFGGFRRGWVSSGPGFVGAGFCLAGSGGCVGQHKIRVAVVFGGRSTEHAVSCATAGLVLSAIDRERYDLLPIGIATDGRWVLTSDDPGRLALSARSSPSVESVALD